MKKVLLCLISLALIGNFPRGDAEEVQSTNNKIAITFIENPNIRRPSVPGMKSPSKLSSAKILPGTGEERSSLKNIGNNKHLI
ncbi:hypothetical protein [Lactococcus formosensis]|jgi:hypothetical protein|uniref:Uncharacterized protein n=1 Tax=Lactococcus formosensis TaxID=1281486 RepID=A0A9Q9D7W1_9LACT|nr:hypothetical protein [Lactococcus formosensis]USJ21444.1 hypothetical protein LMK00_05450 [Lactococcus formosensis]